MISMHIDLSSVVNLTKFCGNGTAVVAKNGCFQFWKIFAIVRINIMPISCTTYCT
uniref:Uncharacterized protein n=1 Tax=Rhizophora mucronata TaxID=61149 RepID=A0A2P2PGT9_RHIMU